MQIDDREMKTNLPKLLADGSNWVIYQDHLIWAIETSALDNHLTIPNITFNHIKGCKTIKDVWDKLKKVYEERLMALVANLTCHFRNKKCGNDESVHAHFEHLANLRKQLAAIGKTVTDDDYLNTMLASLPSSYDHTCSSISVSTRLGSKSLMAEIFEQFILDELECKQVNKRKDTKEEAFSTDTSRKKRLDIECHNCHKCRHIKANCWARGGGKEG